jgi:hypothetical protein
MKYLLSNFICFLYFGICAQNSTIDIEKIENNLSFSILRDTITLGKQLFITYGNTRLDIEEFLENSLNNKPAVHISNENNFYYNSYAVTLLSRFENKMRMNGFEFLSKKDLTQNSFIINNQILNPSPFSVKKTIVTTSDLGSIFNDAEKKINKEELYFRIPEFNSEKCIESFNVFSSNVIYANFSKSSLSELRNVDASKQRCTDGYAILVKETFDHYLNQDNLNYFQIMPDVIALEFRNQIWELMKNQIPTRKYNSNNFKLKCDFSDLGIRKIQIDGLKIDFSLKKKLESITTKYCTIPTFESNFIQSNFSLPITYNYRGSRIKRHSLNLLQSNFRSVDLTTIASSNVKNLNLFKEVVLYREMKVSIDVNGEPYTDDCISILKMKTPNYLISLKSLYGQGGTLKTRLFSTKWLIPLFGITAISSHFLSVNIYKNYINDLNNENNIKKYNTANVFNKISFLTSGFYLITTSIQFRISIQDLNKRRQRVNDFNLRYPNGVNITIPPVFIPPVIN